jgi:hypothetical protein
LAIVIQEANFSKDRNSTWLHGEKLASLKIVNIIKAEFKCIEEWLAILADGKRVAQQAIRIVVLSQVMSDSPHTLAINGMVRPP